MKSLRNQDWQLQKSIAQSIARDPNPSVMRLNEAILEEFGYLPDLELIDFFIETIKQLRNDSQPAKQDPKLALAHRVATGHNPSVPDFCDKYRTQFKQLPPNDVLKYFLSTVRSNRNKASGQTNEALILAERMGLTQRSDFRQFCLQFEQKSGAPPSFEVIDFFIAQLLSDPRYLSH